MDILEQHTNLPQAHDLTHSSRKKRSGLETQGESHAGGKRNINTTYTDHQLKTNINRHKTTHCHTTKKSKSQARQDSWKHHKGYSALKQKYRAFHKGSKQFLRRITPNHTDLAQPQITHTTRDNAQYFDPNGSNINTTRLNLATDQETREMRHMLNLLDDGGVGYMPEKKHNGWIRIMFENWNSLGIYTQSWKLDRLNFLIKHLNIDIVAGCECQTDWTFINTDHQFHSLLSPGRAKKGIAAHNTTERIHRDQGRYCYHRSGTDL